MKQVSSLWLLAGERLSTCNVWACCVRSHASKDKPLPNPPLMERAGWQDVLNRSRDSRSLRSVELSWTVSEIETRQLEDQGRPHSLEVTANAHELLDSSLRCEPSASLVFLPRNGTIYCFDPTANVDHACISLEQWHYAVVLRSFRGTLIVHRCPHTVNAPNYIYHATDRDRTIE